VKYVVEEEEEEVVVDTADVKPCDHDEGAAAGALPVVLPAVTAVVADRQDGSGESNDAVGAPALEDWREEKVRWVLLKGPVLRRVYNEAVKVMALLVSWKLSTYTFLLVLPIQSC
jgi:hypothetical protein